jgi:hypothetical protein
MELPTTEMRATRVLASLLEDMWNGGRASLQQRNLTTTALST